MADDADHVLRAIDEGLRQLPAEVVGRVERTGSAVVAYDRQLILEANVRSDPGSHPSIAHCHVIARLGRTAFTDPLDACVVGIDPDRQRGLEQAGRNWIRNVGGVLFSLLHARPVMDAEHFDGQEVWGVPGCHGFVGPLTGFGAERPDELEALLGAPMFEYAEALAPPGLVHLAKVVLQADGDKGWTRTIEIDGHGASFEEASWQCGVAAPATAVLARHAVFHYGGRAHAVEARRRLDEAIRHLVRAANATDDVEAAFERLHAEGVEADLLHRVTSFVPLALCRVMFAGVGARFSTDFVRVGRDGSTGQFKLMREPAFARSVALCPELLGAGLAEGLKRLAMYSSTFNALNSALNAGSKPENLVMSPPLIPDSDADAAAMEQAIRQLRRPASDAPPAPAAPAPPARKSPAKPWWRFW
jgi:hypothetical protein